LELRDLTVPRYLFCPGKLPKTLYGELFSEGAIHLLMHRSLADRSDRKSNANPLRRRLVNPRDGLGG
jgi:hypothetical protein